jgi:hypothetical protein
VVFVFFALNVTAGSAAASSTKVDFGDISHKGLKNLGPASTGLKLSLELGMKSAEIRSLKYHGKYHSESVPDRPTSGAR